MGKTVGAILVVAAIIAVNFIPGVGQAITGAVVSSGLAAAGTAAAASITTAITTMITSVGLSLATALLAPGAKFNPPETAATPLKVSTPPRVSGYGRSRLYGAYVLFANTDYSVNSETFAPYALDALAVHDGPIDAIELRYLGDKRVELNTSGPYTGYVKKLDHNAYGANLVRWYETLGATPGTANWAEFISKLPAGEWTANHRGDGVVMLGIVWRPVSGDEFSERFPDGAAPASIVARWQKCPDPRNPAHDMSNPATWAWTENAALHLLHYRLVREKAYKAPGAVYPTNAALADAWNLFFEPTRATWEHAADVCDQNIALKAGGTEKRYRSCFAHKHTDAHKETIDALTETFDGWTAPRGDGALVCYAGEYYEPTVEIGPDEIVSYQWQHGVVDEESLNELKLTYISSAHDYQQVDADAWQDIDDQIARGRVRTQGKDFVVPSHGQARRLGKRLMARVMSADRGIITTNVAGRAVRGERYIRLKIIEAGATFFDGVAEITQLTRNVASGGVTFAWVAVNPNIDAWNAATEEGDPAPVKNAVALVAPDAPVVDSAVLVYDQTADGAAGNRISISLSGPSGEDLTWFARWRVVGDPVWNEQHYTDVDSSAGVELVTDFVPVNKSLEVEVAYASGTGALSPWSFPATSVNTDTQLVAPDAATAPVLVSWSDKIVVSCAPIARAKTYRFQFLHPSTLAVIRTVDSPTPQAEYSKAQAHADGVRRDYKVRVAGVNAAGTGTAATMAAAITNPAPAAVTGVVFADGTTTSQGTFTPLTGVTDLVGYFVAWSTVATFNPMTQGANMLAGASPVYTPQLPAGTYYGKIAGYDTWSSQPDLLNFSAEDSFAISTGVGSGSGGAGGGGVGGGGGGGGGGIEN